MSRATAAALACALWAAQAPPAAAQAPKCQMVRIAEWPVRFEGNLPIVEGQINRQPVGILLDTGAYATILMKTAAEKLGLSTRVTAETAIGFGGASRIYLTRLDELRIGGATRQGMRVRVGGERTIRGVDLILGDDFFKLIDLEFDYARGVVRLFEPLNCKDAHIAYWDRNAPSVAMENDQHITVPIKVNGREAVALIDSGASRSIVGLRFAEKVGVTPKTPGVAPASCARGIGADVVRQWVGRFDSVAIGDELIHDARLEIADFMPEMSHLNPEVILGTDFLTAHRVLVSRAQRRVYFSYAGGQVFPATPGLECDEGPRRDVKDTMAELTRAIEANPGDTKALLGRAVLRGRAKDKAGALSDLDAVIRLEPTNGVAYQARMQLRAEMKDLAGALADSDAALANGMDVAHTHSFRAALLIALGEHERSLKELGEAHRLDPRDAGILRVRGLIHFHAGRYEDAEKDFGAILALRPEPFDPVWYAVARERRGLDGRAELEAGLATLKAGEWPAPVMSYLLGRIDRDALMAAAASGDDKQRRGQLCEARFYVAQRLLATGEQVESRALLQKARDECPRDYMEHEAAVRQLGAPR